ncbi:MAG: gamma-glutamylcyclotransferase family protein [Thermodesulfobacteriota bacterium]
MRTPADRRTAERTAADHGAGGGASVWYFAYGSNMQSATLRGRRGVDYRCAVAVRVPGWRLVFDKPPFFPSGNAVANIVPDGAASVLGVAFAMSADDLAHVELTEGVGFGNYRRVELAVEPLVPADGAPTRAFSLASDRRDGAFLPSTRYMSIVIEGALEQGLPAHHIDWLRSVPTCVESAEMAAVRPLLDELFRRRP